MKEQSTEKDKKVLQNKYTERRSEPCKPRKQEMKTDLHTAFNSFLKIIVYENIIQFFLDL